jgi:hypothetical protein
MPSTTRGPAWSAGPTHTDRTTARIRRSDDAVLTEMARSLLREGRSVEDASTGRPTLPRLEARTTCARRTAQRLAAAPMRPRPRARTGAAPVA